MTSVSPFNDIDDKFCMCSICLTQLKEPKLLPCLHRYCKDCLNTLLQATEDVLVCPECRQEVRVPANGVNGFKTDFYTKNLVEYVQIQQSLKSDQMRECFGCSKLLKAAAYCFKCNDFLCQGCHHFHVSNKFLKDHQKHTLSLEDIESKSITIEKLVSMRDAPRCLSHPEKISELYCETCDNFQVCMVCMLGAHKGHNLHEVRELAKSERVMLTQKFETLEKIHKERNVTVPELTKEKLLSNVQSKKVTVLQIYEFNVRSTKTKIDNAEKQRQELKIEKESNEKKIIDSLRKEEEEEIEKVNKKYEELVRVKVEESNNLLKVRERAMGKELVQLKDKLEHLNKGKEELLDSIKMKLDKNLEDIETIADYFKNTDKRFKNLRALASSIIASENDWTAAQCIPDVQAAADNLIKDLRKEFPKLPTLSDVNIYYKQFSIGEPSTHKVSQEAERKIILSNTCHYVNGVTCCGDSNIVISGCPWKKKEVFIFGINLIGTIKWQKNIFSDIINPWHPCDFLSQSKVATVCQPNTVGVYDIRKHSYIKKKISDVINSWPNDRHVKCLATDPVNNHILVGGNNSRDVYVFDDQLNYLHILTFPEMIKWPRDMTVSDEYLLVCDLGGGKAYVTTMNKNGCKVVSEFKELDVGGLKPWSMCKDSHRLVYILWKDLLYGQSYLTQYNPNGSQLITMRKVDNRARVVAVVNTNEGEKLLVATHNTQTLYLYNLLEEE